MSVRDSWAIISQKRNSPVIFRGRYLAQIQMNWISQDQEEGTEERRI